MSIAVDRMQEAVRGRTSVSDKIRALDALGAPRADIARFLGKRYQHVRNVLEADREHASTQPIDQNDQAVCIDNATIDDAESYFRLEVGAGGVVVLPAKIREAWALRDGMIVIARLEGDTLVLENTQASIRRVQAWVQSIVPDDVNLVEVLLAERREAFERELRDH